MDIPPFLQDLSSTQWQGIGAGATVAASLFALITLFKKQPTGGGAVSVAGKGNSVHVGTAISAGEHSKITVQQPPYTIEKHKEELEELRQKLENERDAAVGKEREEKQRALDEAGRKLANLNEDYHQKLSDITALQEQINLLRCTLVEDEEIAKAQAALTIGNTDEAESLLKLIYARSEHEAAKVAYLKNKIKSQK